MVPEAGCSSVQRSRKAPRCYRQNVAGSEGRRGRQGARGKVRQGPDVAPSLATRLSLSAQAYSNLLILSHTIQICPISSNPFQSSRSSIPPYPLASFSPFHTSGIGLFLPILPKCLHFNPTYHSFSYSSQRLPKHYATILGLIVGQHDLKQKNRMIKSSTRFFCGL